MEKNLENFEQMSKDWPRVQGKEEEKILRAKFRSSTSLGRNELSNELTSI